MTLQLETPQVSLRPFVPEDAPLAFPWLTDAEIMRYMPTGQDFTLAQVEARIARYIAHQEQHGYSRWLAIERSSGLPVNRQAGRALNRQPATIAMLFLVCYITGNARLDLRQRKVLPRRHIAHDFGIG